MIIETSSFEDKEAELAPPSSTRPLCERPCSGADDSTQCNDPTIPLLGARTSKRSFLHVFPFRRDVLLSALTVTILMFGILGLVRVFAPSSRKLIEPFPVLLPHGMACFSSQLENLSVSGAPVSVQIPIDAEEIHFDRMGTHAGGEIFFASTFMGPVEYIKVEVLAHHLDQDILGHARVCVQRPHRGDRGVYRVTVLTNISDAYSMEPINYNIKTYFPAPSTSMQRQPRHYDRQETNLRDFHHEVQLPAEHIRFKNVYLRSGMARVSVYALAANDIDIKNARFPINGNFDVGSALALKTELSRLEATMQLHANDVGGTTSISVTNTQGPTWAHVYCRSSSTHPGSFLIDSITSNASSSTMIESLPIGAALNVDARSTAKQVLVELPLTYEGDFDVLSLDVPEQSTPRTRVEMDVDAWDPQGLGRKRDIDVNFIGHHLQGFVFWNTMLGLPRPPQHINSRITMRTTEQALTPLKM